MTELSPRQRRYLLANQGVVSGAINFVLNGAIGYAVFAGVDPVPTWAAESSAGPDLIGTCFFLPAITCLIVTPLVRRDVRAGRVERVTALPLPRSLETFRRGWVARALLFGLAGLIVAGGAVAGVLLLTGSSEVAFSSLLWLKASFSAALAAVVTPLIGLVALADVERSASATAVSSPDT